MSSKHIKIGCKLYTRDEWEKFSDDEIDVMDIGSLEWWKRWKKFILTTHDNLPEIYR